MAATVCKSPRLLCSSRAAAPCTWPLLCSDRSGAPQGLSAPPQPGPLPRPGLPAGLAGRPPPRSYLAHRRPSGEREWGWAKRRRKPRSCAAGWGWGTGQGAGGLLSAGGVPRLYAAPVVRLLTTRGRLRGEAGRQPWPFQAPGAGSACGGAVCSGQEERTTSRRPLAGEACGPCMKPGLEPTPLLTLSV